MSVRTLPVVAPPCPSWCTEAQHAFAHWGGGTYGVLHRYEFGGVEVAQHVVFTADGIIDVEQPGLSWKGLEYVDAATARMHAAQLLTAARFATVAGMTVSDAGPRADRQPPPSGMLPSFCRHRRG
jgi:hypothetical protein